MHGPHYGWSMRQASALLLVPDNVNIVSLANLLATTAGANMTRIAIVFTHNILLNNL